MVCSSSFHTLSLAGSSYRSQYPEPANAAHTLIPSFSPFPHTALLVSTKPAESRKRLLGVSSHTAETVDVLTCTPLHLFFRIELGNDIRFNLALEFVSELELPWLSYWATTAGRDVWRPWLVPSVQQAWAERV